MKLKILSPNSTEINLGLFKTFLRQVSSSQTVKGTRFEQTRRELREGIISAQMVCANGYAQGKPQASNGEQQQKQQMPMTGAPQMGPQGFRPQGPGGPGMIRPRGGPPGMFRPPGGMMRPPGPGMPMQRPPSFVPQQSPRPEFTQNNTSSQEIVQQTISEPIVEQIKPKSQEVAEPTHQRQEPTNEQSTPRQHQQMPPQRQTPPVKKDIPEQPVHTKIPEPEVVPIASISIQENEVNLNKSAHIDNNQLDGSVDQSFDHSRTGDISVDQSDSIFGTVTEDRPYGQIPKGKKKVKKVAKKKKVTTAPGEDEIQPGPDANTEIPAQTESLQKPIVEEAKQIDSQSQALANIGSPQRQEIETQNLRKQSEDEFSYPRQQEEPKIMTNYNAFNTEQAVSQPDHRSPQQMKEELRHELPRQVIEEAPQKSPSAFDKLSTPTNQQQIQAERQESEVDLKTSVVIQSEVLGINDDDDEITSVHPQKEQAQLSPASMAKQQIMQRKNQKSMDMQNEFNRGKPQSVKSFNSQSQTNLQDSEGVKRLNEALSYKRAQKQELAEKIVHLENDNLLQQKKSSILMEEAKSLREELRVKDKELRNRTDRDELTQKQLAARNRVLEDQVKERSLEAENLRKELQKQKEEKLGMKDKLRQVTEESNLQRNQLFNFLKNLEQRCLNGSGQVSGGDQTASNQQEQIENVHKEMKEMKQQYDQRIREMHEELQNRMRQLQRVERNNIELQHKNRQLSDLVATHQVQVISTISGSGSNQRDSQALFPSRRGQPPPDHEEEDEHNRIFTGTEDEGTGGGSYFQTNQARTQINPDHQHHYGYGEEGGNLADHFEEEGFDGSEGAHRARNSLSYNHPQNDAVGGVHSIFEEEGEQDDDLEDEDDFEYEDGEGDHNMGGEFDEEDEEGNQNEEDSSALHQDRDGYRQSLNQQQQFSLNFQEEGGEGGSAGGAHAQVRRSRQNEERKQGQRNKRRRGNTQQNQQHSSTAANSNSQNPRQRNGRGRQQRSNQQQMPQIDSIPQSQVVNETSGSLIAPPSSQVPLNQFRQPVGQIGSQNAHNEYFQSFGDSSGALLYSSRDLPFSAQSIHHTNQSREGGVAGQGVVHTATAGRGTNLSDMMSAESGSTAFIDKNQYQRVNQQRAQQQQNLQSQQLQTGSNNNQTIHAQSQHTSQVDVGDSDISAAVGAPSLRAAAPPRNQRQNPNLIQNSQISDLFAEESKQSSGESYYGSNQNLNIASGRYNQFNVGGSGEQEEDSSVVFNSNLPQSSFNQSSHLNFGGSSRRNDSYGQKQGQSSTPNRNDSKKTSGANTPNKDGADTPTTKDYKGYQQQQNSYVHNLTSNQLLFYSNQEEGEASTSQAQQNSQMMKDPDVIPQNMFE